jgi:hypothetical protein
MRAGVAHVLPRRLIWGYRILDDVEHVRLAEIKKILKAVRVIRSGTSVPILNPTGCSQMSLSRASLSLLPCFAVDAGIAMLQVSRLAKITSLREAHRLEGFTYGLPRLSSEA